MSSHAQETVDGIKKIAHVLDEMKKTIKETFFEEEILSEATQTNEHLEKISLELKSTNEVLSDMAASIKTLSDLFATYLESEGIH